MFENFEYFPRKRFGFIVLAQGEPLGEWKKFRGKLDDLSKLIHPNFQCKRRQKLTGKGISQKE